MKIVCVLALLGLAGVVLVGAQRSPKCAQCERSACPDIIEAECTAGVMYDECGCCHVCARTLDQNCGGKYWNIGRCGKDYFCQGPHPERQINIRKGEIGFCKCRQVERVCGSDGIVYENICALNETSAQEMRTGGNRIVRSENRDICRSEPTITIPPAGSEKTAGEQTYMRCEAEGFPTPVITWKKEGAVLPGDSTNIAVQTIGGPKNNQATCWVLFTPVMAHDAGEYTCEVTNDVGETARASAELVVSPRE